MILDKDGQVQADKQTERPADEVSAVGPLSPCGGVRLCPRWRLWGVCLRFVRGFRFGSSIGSRRPRPVFAVSSAVALSRVPATELADSWIGGCAFRVVVLHLS